MGGIKEGLWLYVDRLAFGSEHLALKGGEYTWYASCGSRV